MEHLAIIIREKGTLFFRPNIANACKEIAKSIGDRDTSVRMAALNCFVAVFSKHGDDLFKYVNNVKTKN